MLNKFIETYCYEMMPFDIDFKNWSFYLKDELAFASQFFLLETEFKEPYRKLKPQEISNS